MLLGSDHIPIHFPIFFITLLSLSLSLRTMGASSALSWVLLCIVLLCLCFQLIQSNVSYDRKALVINGQRKILFSGSIHYPRSTPEVLSLIHLFGVSIPHSVPKCDWFVSCFDNPLYNGIIVNEMQMWEGLIEKAKDGGLDVIDTYVFWNLHEPSPGNVLWLTAITIDCILFKPFHFVLLICPLLSSLGCSTILKGEMIWFASLRWSKRQGFMCIFALGRTFVQNGILGNDHLFP